MELVQGGEVPTPQSTRAPPPALGFGFLSFCNSGRSGHGWVHTSPLLTAAAVLHI